MNKKEILEWNKAQLQLNGTGQQPNTAAQMIVRNIGDAKKATLPDGETVVERQEYLWVDGHGLIRCAPYELHFIYVMPVKFKGWGLYCTCGSIAGVVGFNAYSKLASPTYDGKMIVCLRHTATKNNDTWGEHADGSHE